MNLSSVPFVTDFWKGMWDVIFVSEIFSFVLLALTTILTTRMNCNIHKFVKNDEIRNYLYWIVSAPWFVSVTCVVGNILPRSATVMYAIGLTYLMVCLYRVFPLALLVFGGRLELSEWLIERGRRIRFSTSPLCCCCKCLPSAHPSPKNLLILRYFVEQSPIVRILIQISLIVLALEKVPNDGIAAQTLDAIGVVSTLLGVYIIHILLEMTGDYLEQFGLKLLFRCADVQQMLFTVVKFVFDSVAKNGVFRENDLMTPTSLGAYWFNVVTVTLMFLFSALYVYRIRPGKSALFDRDLISEHRIGLGRNRKDSKILIVQSSV